MKSLSVAVLAFDRISPFHLSVPCLVFGDRFPGLPPFDFHVCADTEGPLQTTAGFSIQVEGGLQALKQADIVIVPSWPGPATPPSTAVLQALQAAYRRGAQIVGLCLGAYVLAEAGLLNGKRATTHWAYATDFAARYPAVRLDADVIYVEEDRVLTSAGTAAALDCCLHLIRQRFGGEVANRLARRMVIPPHRQGGQSQFIEQPVPVNNRDSRLSGLLDWVRQDLRHEHTIDSLAEKVMMSRRTFTRHFRQLTGTTFGQWLLTERLSLSQRLLESGDQSVEMIAGLAGFGSVESFRLHFRNQFGVSPLAWRKTFAYLDSDME